MKIRKATLNDIKDISRIHALSWKSAYKGIISQQYLDDLQEDFWVSAFQFWIEGNYLTVQIILDDQKPIGCISYGKSRDDKLPDWGEIVSIYLLPEYFATGNGQRLFDAALSELKESGYKNIFLWVLKENHRARKFYEKNGFQCSQDECTFEIMGRKYIDIRYIYS